MWKSVRNAGIDTDSPVPHKIVVNPQVVAKLGGYQSSLPKGFGDLTAFQANLDSHVDVWKQQEEQRKAAEREESARRAREREEDRARDERIARFDEERRQGGWGGASSRSGRHVSSSRSSSGPSCNGDAPGVNNNPNGVDCSVKTGASK
jgi:hypothetical protein